MPPKPTALAIAAQKTPALAALGLMWQQRTDAGETDAEYWSFLDWLDRGANRGAPADLQLAARHEWAERALAFERANELQTRMNAAGASGKSPEQQVVDNLTAMVQIEAQKALERSAKDPTSTVALKDLLATVNLIAELQKKALVAQAATKYDYAKLTTDELREFHRLVRKMTAH